MNIICRIHHLGAVEFFTGGKGKELMLANGRSLTTKGQSRRRGHGAGMLGRAMVITGFVAYWVLRILAQALAENTNTWAGKVVWLGLGFLGIIVAGVVLQLGILVSLRGRRHLAKVTSLSPQALDRDFVLYLRSFDSDKVLSLPLNTRSGGEMFFSKYTEEEQLAAAVKTVGSLVAVGRPGETLPYAGAERGYVPADHWQDTVVHMLGAARLVLLGTGRSAGLIWELAQATKLVPPERLVLLVPAGREDYEQFRAIGSRFFPRGLPEWLPEKESKAYAKATHIKAGVYFAADWTPTLVRFDSRRTRGLHACQTESAFVYQLKPVYERLGAPWPGIGLRMPRRFSMTKRQMRRIVFIISEALILIVLAGLILHFR